MEACLVHRKLESSPALRYKLAVPVLMLERLTVSRFHAFAECMTFGHTQAQ